MIGTSEEEEKWLPAFALANQKWHSGAVLASPFVSRIDFQFTYLLGDP
jgi:hypothetical protein